MNAGWPGRSFGDRRWRCHQPCGKGFTTGGPGGPGGISHCCTKTDNGIRVIDVWESQEAFERFAQEKIGPITADVGIPDHPKVTFFDVHNYLTAG